MTLDDLLIRCLAMRQGSQWVAMCLPFDLAAQAETLAEAREKLAAQIRSYLYDALAGEDREHATHLLARRAPLRYWMLYFLSWMAQPAFAPRVRNFKLPAPLSPSS